MPRVRFLLFGPSVIYYPLIISTQFFLRPFTKNTNDNDHDSFHTTPFHTTPFIEEANVVKYLSVVSGETILSPSLFRDMSATVRDIVGGRTRR